MKRRKFITLLGVAAMAWPLVAHAQEPKKIPHLCFLTFDPGTLQSSPRFDVFFNGLRDLGYVDGKTIAIDYLSAKRALLSLKRKSFSKLGSYAVPMAVERVLSA